MEDQSNNQQHPEGCKCWKCQGGQMDCGYCRKHNPWYHLARWALAILVIVVVFWFGLFIGRLEGQLGGGRTMMRHSYSGGYGHAYPMMQGGYGSMGTHSQATQSAPSATSNQ